MSKLVSVPIDSFLENSLSNIKSALEDCPADVDHALALINQALDRARQDAQEMCRLRHEIAQYSDLTKNLLLESGKLRTQLEDAKTEGDRIDRERADANRRCTGALIELKQAHKRLHLLEAQMESSVKDK